MTAIPVSVNPENTTHGDAHVESNDAACHIRHFGNLAVGEHSVMMPTAPVKLDKVMRVDTQKNNKITAGASEPQQAVAYQVIHS